MSCARPRVKKGVLETREYAAVFYNYPEIRKFGQSLVSGEVIISGEDNELSVSSVRVIDEDEDGKNERVGVLLTGGTQGVVYLLKVTGTTDAAPARILELACEVEVTE